MIRLENIWKTFVMGEETLHALKAVTETISAGEHIAIMGPSGSGKSTLLNILGCLDRPSQGTYFFEDREVEILDPDELARIRLHEIGFIFQSFHLVPRLDALANIELPMTLAELPARNAESEHSVRFAPSGSKPGPITVHQSSRAAKNSALQSRGLLSCSRECSSPMSRPETWTPRPGSRSSQSWKDCDSRESHWLSFDPVVLPLEGDLVVVEGDQAAV